MNKKTFQAALWLMIGCGLLAILAVPVFKPAPPTPPAPPVKPQKNMALAWSLGVDRNPVSFLAFEDKGKTLVGRGDVMVRVNVANKKVTSKRNIKNLQFSGDGRFFIRFNKGNVARKVKIFFDTKKHLSKGVPPFYIADLWQGRRIDLYNTKSPKPLFTLPLPDDTPNVEWIIENIYVKGSPPTVMAQLVRENRKPRLTRYEYQILDGKSGQIKSVKMSPPSMDYDFIFIRKRMRNAIFLDNPVRLMRLVSMDDKGLEIGDRRENIFWRDELRGLSTLLNKVHEGERHTELAAVSLSPNQSRLYAARQSSVDGFSFDDKYGAVISINLHTKTRLWKTTEAGFRPTLTLPSADGKYVACSGIEISKSYSFLLSGKIVLLNAHTGEIVARFSTNTWQAQDARWKKFWKTRNRGPIRPLASGETGEVFSLAFSPDDRYLAAGYENGSIKLWRIP